MLGLAGMPRLRADTGCALERSPQWPSSARYRIDFAGGGVPTGGRQQHGKPIPSCCSGAGRPVDGSEWWWVYHDRLQARAIGPGHMGHSIRAHVKGGSRGIATEAHAQSQVLTRALALLGVQTSGPLLRARVCASGRRPICACTPSPWRMYSVHGRPFRPIHSPIRPSTRSRRRSGSLVSGGPCLDTVKSMQPTSPVTPTVPSQC